jgi:hypothetical protein
LFPFEVLVSVIQLASVLVPLNDGSAERSVFQGTVFAYSPGLRGGSVSLSLCAFGSACWQIHLCPSVFKKEAHESVNQLRSFYC